MNVLVPLITPRLDFLRHAMTRRMMLPRRVRDEGRQKAEGARHWTYKADLSRRTNKGFGTFLIDHAGRAAILKLPNSLVRRDPMKSRVALLPGNVSDEVQRRFRAESFIYSRAESLCHVSPYKIRMPEVYEMEPGRFRITEFISGPSAFEAITQSQDLLPESLNKNLDLIESFEKVLNEEIRSSVGMDFLRMEDNLDEKRFQEALTGLVSVLPSDVLMRLQRLPSFDAPPLPVRLIARDLTLQNILIDASGTWCPFDFELFAFSLNSESVASVITPLLYDTNLLRSGLEVMGEYHKNSRQLRYVQFTTISLLCGHLDVARKFCTGIWRSSQFPPEREIHRFTAIRHCLESMSGILSS